MKFEAEFETRCLCPSDIVEHLPYLYEAGAGHRTIELGVRSGNSTAAFLAACESHGGHVWSVDVTKPDVPPEWESSPLWDLYVGDDLDPVVMRQLPENVDVVFIDTSHTYHQTIDELVAYHERLVPGGRFLLHDTELQWAPNDVGGVEYPVRRAIDDFVDIFSWRFEHHDGCYGLGIIHKPGAP